jgi:O-acetylserine/cysteine efflux transporter
VFAAIFLREALAPRMALGILIAAFGIGTLGYARASGAEAGAAALPTVLLSLTAAAGWAGASNCSRYALMQGVDRYITIAAGQTIGMLVAIGVLFAAGRGELLWSTDLKSTSLFLVVGVLGTIAFVCLTYALSLTTVASASLFGGTSPIISTTLAVLLLGERLGWLTLFGTALTLVGVWVFQSSPLRPGVDGMQV